MIVIPTPKVTRSKDSKPKKLPSHLLELFNLITNTCNNTQRTEQTLAFLRPLVVYDKVTSMYTLVPTAGTVKTEAGLQDVLRSEKFEPTGPAIPKGFLDRIRKLF